jgi:hypothetical protein
MPHRCSLSAVLVVLALATGCASAPKEVSPQTGTETSNVKPPELIRGSPPELRVPTSTSSRATVNIELEVMVDATGRPDMRSFKAVGFGADVNRDALRTWMESASFIPARLGDRAVPGLFKMRLQAVSRRM